MDYFQKQLLQEGLLSEKQENLLTQIEEEKVVSVFFETRSLLYLGVLLLTSGISLLIYQNLGEIAHLALLSVLIILEAASWYYIITHQPRYSHQESKSPTPYFDYVVLLATLLIVSILTYSMIQFNVLEMFLQWSSLISAILFFFIAFRYDHKGVLTLAITAFCAFWGLTISPVNWVQFDFDSYRSLYISGIFMGLGLTGTGFVLHLKNIKPHFKFTFQNLGLLILYIGLISGQIESDNWVIYSLMGVVLSVAVAIYFWKQREYLLFVYGAVGGYFSFTRWLVEIAENMEPELWLMYILASMGGFIMLIERIINAQRKAKRNDSV